MLKNKRTAILASLLFVFGLLIGSVTTGTVMAAQPFMFGALKALHTALNDLNQALPDKGGHRVNAINLVNQAIGEVKAGIQAGQ